MACEQDKMTSDRDAGVSIAQREMTAGEWIDGRCELLARELAGWRELKAHLPAAYLQRGVSLSIATLTATRHG